MNSVTPPGHYMNLLCEACATQDWTVGVTTELYASAKTDGKIQSRLSGIEIYVAQRPKGSHREDGLITRLLLLEDDLELTAAVLLERMQQKGLLPEQSV